VTPRWKRQSEFRPDGHNDLSSLMMSPVERVPCQKLHVIEQYASPQSISHHLTDGTRSLYKTKLRKGPLGEIADGRIGIGPVHFLEPTDDRLARLL